MKKLLGLSLLAVGGCGFTVTVAEPEQAQPVAPQPVPPQPVPPAPPTPPQPTTVAGTYVGNSECVYMSNFSGTTTSNNLATVTLDNDGIPILSADGAIRFVGENTQILNGLNTILCTTTDITRTGNGVVIRERCNRYVDGFDTCQYARDGVCDEPSFCAWSSDFTDCGPVRWDGSMTTTYLFQDDGTVFETFVRSFTESKIGEATTRIECTTSFVR